MNKAEATIKKIETINGLHKEILDCFDQMTAIAKKGASKYPKVTIRRAFKILALAMTARQIKMQIDIVKAQPTEPGKPVLLVGSKMLDNQKCKERILTFKNE